MISAASHRKAATSVVTTISTEPCCKLVPEKKAGSEEKADSWVFVYKDNCLFPDAVSLNPCQKDSCYSASMCSKGYGHRCEDRDPYSPYVPMRHTLSADIAECRRQQYFSECTTLLAQNSSHAQSKRGLVVTPITTECNRYTVWLHMLP